METNVQQAVPFFRVSNIEASVRYYVDGLGFEMTKKWIDDGQAPLVLAPAWERRPDAAGVSQRRAAMPGRRKAKLGVGVSICFTCKDALAIYREITSRGIAATRPFVGNAMWVTSVRGPRRLQT